MFDDFLINVIIVLFPYFVYLFYISANRKLDWREKNIFQFLITVLSFLILIKYGFNKDTVLLLLNIPILFSLINKKYITYSLLIFLICLIYKVSMINSILLVINYLLVLLGSFRFKNRVLFIIYFIILNIVSYLVIFNLYDAVYAIISFPLLLSIFYILYHKGEEILGFNHELNELQKEKEIRVSLFKITHEIKNPIAVCKAYLDMYDINDKKKSVKYIKIVKSEIDRLLCLLEDFMLVNKDNINCDIMDINLLLEEKIKNINELMNVRNIKINYELNDDEIYVFGDYNRLSQVFINLIKNSIEAKSKNITLKCYTKNNNVIVNIIDDGTGINKDAILKIKEPFYTTKIKGTGLGVSLSNEIVLAHHGKLKYESEYGRGTSVKVILPLYELWFKKNSKYGKM